MKNVLFLAFWLALAVTAYAFDQPLITEVIALLAITEAYANSRLRQTSSTGHHGESTVSQAFTTANTGTGGRRKRWMALL